MLIVFLFFIMGVFVVRFLPSFLRFAVNFVKFFCVKIYDVYIAIKNGRAFNEFGVTFFTGRQGSGKSMSMVRYLDDIRLKYPDALILTNFGYKFETMPFTDWEQFFTVRNGVKGVVFAIDEIQNEFSSSASKDFPEFLLKEITQQRKQRIKIICSSQTFTRTAKPLREQAFDVVECRCIARRWVFQRCFDADEYNDYIDGPSPDKKMKVKRKWRINFIITSELGSKFDSFRKIERMSRTKFSPRSERLYN